MNFKPLNNRVIVERIEAVKMTDSGIILQSTQTPDKGIVLAVADGVDEVKVGEKLLVNWNKCVKIEDEKYHVCIDDVVAVFEE